MEATSLSNYEKKIICDLIETSKSIYSVHERLMQAEKIKDENELIKLRRNLNLAVDVENDLWNL